MNTLYKLPSLRYQYQEAEQKATPKNASYRHSLLSPFPISPTPILFHLFTLSSLLTTQEAFVDSVDQDQTAQNVQSDP